MKLYTTLACLCLGAISLAPSLAYSQSQSEMNAQAFNDFTKSDKKLNEAYRKLISKLDAQSKKKLITSQKAWLAFRDAEAELEADMVARGGSLSPLIYHATRDALTQERTKKLLQHLKWGEDDNS